MPKKKPYGQADAIEASYSIGNQTETKAEREAREDFERKQERRRRDMRRGGERYGPGWRARERGGASGEGTS